jgi:hypothetical protein
MIGSRVARSSLSIALLVFLALPSLNTASAQAPTAEPSLTRIGPYLVNIRPDHLRPYIGDELIAVTVLDAATRLPVGNASVEIQALNATTRLQGFATALNTKAVPEHYTAAVRLDSAGVWELTVEISGPLGNVAVPIPPSEIRTPSQSGLGYLIFSISIGGIALGALHLWRSAHRRPQSHA